MPLVSGRVITPSGQPAAGVYVYAWDRDQPQRRVDTHTDAAGAWTLELPAGAWTVRDGQRSRPITVPASAPTASDPNGGTGIDTGIDTTRGSAAVPDHTTLAATLRRAGRRGDTP